jgi:hypothetical protein
VQIQDDAHVLNATAVQNDAATLPVGVYVWATTQDAESKSVFDTDVRNKVNAAFPIVIGINTVPAQPAGFGVGFVLLVVLVVGVIAAVVFMTRRRSRSGFGSGPSTLAGPPPRDPYPDYRPSYGGPAYGGPGYHSGMGAGTAGAIGALGGGLLGYELGKMHGEQQ